jgi:oxamate amidohydrolase
MTMMQTLRARRGMVVAPHHLAAQSGLAILREGGTAVEAMVAAATTIAVVYPHMNSIGGDGFWLIAEPGRAPVGIEACGAAAALATPELLRRHGFDAVPTRGPFAALTVAGTVSGWEAALQLSSAWAKPIPLERLLADAIEYAENGAPAPEGFCAAIRDKRAECESVPGFKDLFLAEELPQTGRLLKNPALAATFRRLASAGLDDFYCGETARSTAADLESAGSPLRRADFEAHRAKIVTPLSVRLHAGEVFNLPPPTQGLASLLILALYDRMAAAEPDGFDHIHRLVECTKAAFRIRDAAVADPGHAPAPVDSFLEEASVAELASAIDLRRARPWPEQRPGAGDTVWLGAIDSEGRAVSFIQSTYWEFGCGIVLPQNGVNWQNRGASFSLDLASLNALAPGKKPFHTLNPALARLNDGRVIVYGSMGGDGQPQTQAAVFSRYVHHGYDLQAAIAAPRWLLGRTWGSHSATLKLEGRFPEDVFRQLESAGHRVEKLAPFASDMGHAGAIVLAANSSISGAFDPRSDGAAAAY